MHRGGNYARGGGNGHSDKVFSAGSSGIGGLRIHLNIKARQTACARHQKNKRGNHSQLRNAGMDFRMAKIRQHVDSPRPGEQGGSQTKRDHVRQGIEFPSEIAGGIGHARHETIQTVCQNRKANGFGRYIEVRVVVFQTSLHHARNGALDGVGNREITGPDVGGGKNRRQNVHAFSHASLLCGGNIFPSPQGDWHLHWTSSDIGFTSIPLSCCALLLGAGVRASTEAPPFTRSPTATLISAGFIKITSVRDPNLMSPTLSPRATLSPIFFVKTIRRASSPAICLNTSVMPSPSMVTMFCSLSSAEASLMALPKCPRL